MRTVVNVAELAKPDWNFIQDIYPDSHGINWQYFTATPKNRLERLIKRPKLSRYRACWQAARALQQEQDIIISHMPRLTHWQSVLLHMTGKRNRHLAFSFNFTQLPGATLQRAMHRSLARVEQFVVYSAFERQRYATYFDLPIEKFHHLFWAMDPPKTDENFPLPDTDYYCAAGGEGRDYATLLEAFRRLPHLKLVIVTRPHAMQGLTPPDNVSVLFNLDNRAFWRIIQQSQALIVPLLDDQTACGHITLVGAMQLGVPIISSFSHGTEDYLLPDHNSLVTPNRDGLALTRAIERLQETPQLARQLTDNAAQFAQTHCNPVRWAQHIQHFVTHTPPS